MKIKKINQSAGVVANVVDNLNSTTALDALSANQGKILNEKIEENKLELDKFNYIGGHNFIISNSHHIEMVQPAGHYNKYDFYIEHPMVLVKSSNDHYYTLSFKYIPTSSEYLPAQSIVVGGMGSADAWQIRLYMHEFKIEHYADYQLWSATFIIRGNNDDFLQNHVGFVLESSGGPYGGVVKEVKLENGKVRTDFAFNTAGIHSATWNPVVGTWIDGKPIYRKVISGAPLGNASNEWHVLGTIPGFNTITRFEGFLLGGSPGAHVFEVFPCAYDKGRITVMFDQASGEIRERHGYDELNNYWSYMIIEYTLIADAATIALLDESNIES